MADKNVDINEEEWVLPSKEERKRRQQSKERLNMKTSEAEIKELQDEAEKISVTDEVREAEKSVKKQRTKIQGVLNLTFFVINVTCFIGVLYFVYLYYGRTAIHELFLTDSDIMFFICGILGIVIITMFIETLRIYLLILKHTKKSRWFLSLKTVCVGKFYSLITPIKKGGQTNQITYLYKNNVKASVASSIPITEHVFKNLVFLISSVLLLAFGSNVFSVDDLFIGFVSVWAHIGIGLNFLVMFIIILLSNEKKTGRGITIGVLKLLHKIKIIKDYRASYIKVMKFVRDYQRTMRATISNFPLFLGMVVSSVVILILRLSIPFVLRVSFFGLESFTWNYFIVMLARMFVCELAFGFWLLPGNVVVGDLAFIALFRDFFPQGTLFWAILIWRILTYYIYIIQGQGVKLTDYIKKKLEARKTTKLDETKQTTQ